MLNDTGYGNERQIFETLSEQLLTPNPQVPLAPLEPRAEWGSGETPQCMETIPPLLVMAWVYLIGALVVWQLMEWSSR